MIHAKVNTLSNFQMLAALKDKSNSSNFYFKLIRTVVLLKTLQYVDILIVHIQKCRS